MTSEGNNFCTFWNVIAACHHDQMVKNGFWALNESARNLRIEKIYRICLMHEELGEATTGVRTDAWDDKIADRKAEEVELADCILRIMDYAEGYGLDVGTALIEKMHYNSTRPFMHGKKA